MVVYLISFKADLENLSSITFPADHEWILSFRDQNGDERRDVRVCAQETVEIPGSRGTANLMLKFPGGTSSIAFTTVKGISGTYTNSGSFQTVAALECRGAELFAWKPSGFYVAQTSEERSFDSVDLQEGDWCDFCEELDSSVGVYNVEWKIERGK